MQMRVKAVLRRSGSPREGQSTPLRIDELEINPLRREVRIGGRLIDLRTQEFELLLTLAGQPGLVFTREQLLQLAWGFDFYGQTRTVDVHIAWLRQKLEDDAKQPKHILTIHGLGYRFSA